MYPLLVQKIEVFTHSKESRRVCGQGKKERKGEGCGLITRGFYCFPLHDGLGASNLQGQVCTKKAQLYHITTTCEVYLNNNSQPHLA